ncbi:hypothetical protein [Floridanema evergladense]|uniref:Molecular chaperone DnaJ n=1 Tax=Floridaenema evergladense BLCC-F167 TaxID=3153639 RepID=A0ABV4WF33_9CYAN
MPNYKEYKSVSEFPLHIQNLSREELEKAYQEIRTTYRSLTNSRAQLVRRQSEAKTNLVKLQNNLKQTTTALEKVNAEREKLQKSLAHSVAVQKELKVWGESLNEQVGGLKEQMNATNQLLEEFESVYEEVNKEQGVLSIGRRFYLLLTAAKRLLNTDIQDLIFKNKTASAQEESWAEETPENINRKLLDD